MSKKKYLDDSYENALLIIANTPGVGNAEDLMEHAKKSKKITALYLPRIEEYLDAISSSKAEFINKHDISTHEDHGFFESLSYPDRFLKDYSENDISFILSANTAVFFLGLVTFFMIWQHPKRYDVNKLSKKDRTEFADTMLEGYERGTLTADRQVKPLFADSNYAEPGIYEHFFDSELKDELVSRFGHGRFKVSKDRSYFNNIFSAGYLLGMKHDTASASL